MKRYFFLFSFLVFQWPIASLVSSFLSSPAGGSKFNIFIVYCLVVIADVFTDTVVYLIGRYAKEWLVSRYPKFISIAPERFAIIEEYFKEEGMQTLALAKLSHAAGMPVLIVAGSARYPYKKFFLVNFGTSLIKSLLLVSFGYYYGRHYKVLLHYLGRAGSIFIALMAVLVAYFVLTRKRKKKRA